MNKREQSQYDLPELEGHERLDNLIVELAKKHREHEAAVKRGDTVLAYKTEEEFNTMLAEMRMNHPNAPLDESELDLKMKAEDATWRLHHKPDYKDLN
jgi:hypothetical protein